LDDSPRDPSSSTTTDLMDAIEQYLEGKAITNKRTESIGCSVKWKE
ncbi:MAG TPA: thioredoxin family protein, partial [Candidatus Poseidoniales archaeon]